MHTLYVPFFLGTTTTALAYGLYDDLTTPFSNHSCTWSRPPDLHTLWPRRSRFVIFQPKKSLFFHINSCEITWIPHYLRAAWTISVRLELLQTWFYISCINKASNLLLIYMHAFCWNKINRNTKIHVVTNKYFLFAMLCVGKPLVNGFKMT